MTRTGRGDRETRDRLLAEAAALFADQGFRKVTVREICRAADANVAAVNYHFGDKLGLYRDVLQSAIDTMRATSEAARAAGKGLPAEAQLRSFLRVYLRRVLGAGSSTWIYRLIHREMADPTPAFDALVEEGIRPRIDYLARIVMELSGCERNNPLVMRCVASIQAQSVFYMPNPIAARLGVKEPFTPDEIDLIADHIAEFSLAGIRAASIAHHRQRPEGSDRSPVHVRAALRSTAGRRR
jgi:TetR/AcrR family transcriptional regulator, regulator of cefoperazone and chloramphenicol sensitivity